MVWPEYPKTVFYNNSAIAGTTTLFNDPNITDGRNITIPYVSQSISDIYEFQGVMGDQFLLRNFNPIKIWTATLADGNAVITYVQSNVDRAYFQIIDDNGNKVVDHTQFNNYTSNNKIRGMACDGLDNGNFIIQFEVQLGSTGTGWGKFAIFDATGSKIVDDVTYKSNRTLYPNPKQMSNGNIAVSFNDFIQDQDGEYKVYDITGSYTGDGYNFQVGTAYQTHPILANTSEGKLMIIWSDNTQDLKGRNMIPNVTASTFRDNIDITEGTNNDPAGKGAELVDGNIAMLYGGVSLYPSIRIFDKDIQDVKGETLIGNGAVSAGSGDCVPLADGKFFVAWRSDANPHYSGSFKIFSADGTVSSSATTIATSSIVNLRATRVGDNVIVTYEAASKIFYRIIS